MNESLRGPREEAMRAYRSPDHARSRENVEQALQERYEDTPEAIQARAEFIFAFPKGTVELSKEERDDVQRFTEYVGKRLVHAELFSPIILGNPNEKPEGFHPLQDHDLTHAIVTYGYSKRKSSLPEFLLADPDDVYSDPKVLQEEMTANLWGANAEGTPFRNILQANTFDDLRQYFAEVGFSEAVVEKMKADIVDLNGKTYEGALAINHVYFREFSRMLAIYDAQNAGKDPSRYMSEDSPHDAAIEFMRLHPDPMYLEVTRNIFDNQSDPKVLFAEFTRVCAPLLESLRKRSQYSDEARETRRENLAEAKRKLQRLRDEF